MIVNASDQYGPWTKVVDIYSPANGNSPFIRFGANSMPGCYDNSGGYLPLSNPEAANRVYSTILSALMAKQDIKVHFNFNTASAGYNGWGLCNIESVSVR